MKKKILLTLICSATICLIGALAACSDTPHEHTWNEGEVTTPATCGSTGIMTYSCTGCDETKTEIIPKTDHPYSEEWLKNEDEHWHATTCEHTTERMCVSEHTWDNVEVIREANCQSTGLIKYTCVCGLTKTETVDITDHSYSTWSYDDDKHWRVCTTEGCNEISDEGEHNWDSGVVTVSASCQSTGVLTYTCLDCNMTKTETIGKTEHVFSTEWTSDDNSHWHACTTTGCTERQDEHEHSYGEWTQAGQMVQTCSICNHERHAPYLSVNGQSLTETVKSSDGSYLTFFTRGTGYYTFTFTCEVVITVKIEYYDRLGAFYDPEYTITQTNNSITLKLWDRSVAYLTIGTASEDAKEYTVQAEFSETMPQHTHSFSTEWSTDGSYHWHACTDPNCEEEIDTGLHEFDGNGVCTVCGYNKNSN